jgi:hypothetical protein
MGNVHAKPNVKQAAREVGRRREKKNEQFTTGLLGLGRGVVKTYFVLRVDCEGVHENMAVGEGRVRPMVPTQTAGTKSHQAGETRSFVNSASCVGRQTCGATRVLSTGTRQMQPQLRLQPVSSGRHRNSQSCGRGRERLAELQREVAWHLGWGIEDGWLIGARSTLRLCRLHGRKHDRC